MMRHVILQAAMGGAAIMLLLTIGLLFLGRVSKAPAAPKPPRVRAAAPEQSRRRSGTGTDPSRLAQTVAIAEPALTEPNLAEPALTEPALTAPATAEPAPAEPDPGEPSSWPDFLALPGDVAEPIAPPAPKAPEVSEPVITEPQGHGIPAQRHQVALGDDQIEIVLAGGPGRETGSCVRWAPLPYDVPEDGLAFSCIGAGDEGCLFVDLAAAPGPVEITGDADAVIRLAESIAHQLGTDAGASPALSVLLVGDSIPKPHPAGAMAVPELSDLPAFSLDKPESRVDIVFCNLRSDEDAATLARVAADSRHRIVPVVLGHLPGAAWSFTARSGC